MGESEKMKQVREFPVAQLPHPAHLGRQVLGAPNSGPNLYSAAVRNTQTHTVSSLPAL